MADGQISNVAEQNKANDADQSSSQKAPVSTEQELTKLITKLKEYMPPESLVQVHAAYEFAREHHADQTRKSGEPYITHPMAVAQILADMKLDLHSIVAALLHDAVEDTPATLEDINKIFGPQITTLVDGLTKIGKISFGSSQERLAENFRKI